MDISVNYSYKYVLITFVSLQFSNNFEIKINKNISSYTTF